MLPTFLFLAAVAVLLPATRAQRLLESAQQKQCNRTDHVPVEIYLNNTEESILANCNRDLYGDCNNYDARYSLYFKVNGTQNQGNRLREAVGRGVFFSEYSEAMYNSVQKVSHCVPRGQCIVATTQEVPPGQISIYRDGEPVDIGPTKATRLDYPDVRYITTTEIGPCKPECDPNEEVLWEMDMYKGWANVYPWSLESLEGGQIMADCQTSDACAADGFVGPIRTFRQCLPTNRCYRLIAEMPDYPRTETLPMFSPESTINITIQGTQEAALSYFSYAAYEFGAGECPVENKNQKCEPHESLFEIFLKRKYGKEQVLFWNVTKYDIQQENISHSFLAGKFEIDAGLHYAQGCLPKNQCFNVTIAPSSYNAMRPEQGRYRLVLDGIIYYDNTYNQDPFDDFDENTMIGDCASMDCPNENDALFDMTISTGKNKPGTLDVNQWFVEIPGDLNFEQWAYNRDRQTEEMKRFVTMREQFYDELRRSDIGLNAPPETTYRNYACVPKNICSKFDIYLNLTYLNLTVIFDGQEQTLEECESSYEDCLWKSQPWGNTCPSAKLSKDAVAGIVLGCLAFVCLVGMIFFIYRYRYGHRETPNNNGGSSDIRSRRDSFSA